MRGILGADIFVNLLLVFIITTGLLLMNSNKTVKSEIAAQNEKNMPKIQLPHGDSEGTQNENTERTGSLSVQGGKEGITYYVDKKNIPFERLADELKERQFMSLRIRCDREIPYGEYVKLLDVCKKLGIKNIYNVYVMDAKED